MIPLFKVYMSKNAKKEVGKVLDSGFIGQGPVVEKFEELLRKRFNNELVVTTNSGTSAEHLAKTNPQKKHDEWKYIYVGKKTQIKIFTISNFWIII